MLAELTTCIQKTHAERLLPSIQSLLKTIGAKADDIDSFALTIGPGSFTGLRIGLSTIKGLAWSLKKPVVGVSTLQALAMNVPYSDMQICPVLDARKKEVYAGIYRFQDSECLCIMPDAAISPTTLIEQIQEPTIFTGDGIQVFKSQISSLKSQIVFAPSHLWPIKASNIGLLAWKRFKSGNMDKPENIRLNYLRPSEAELKPSFFLL